MASSVIMRGHGVTKTILNTRSIATGVTYTLSDSIENYDLVLFEASGYDNYYSAIYLGSELMSRINRAHWIPPIASGYALNFQVVSGTQIKVAGKESNVSTLEIYGIKL